MTTAITEEQAMRALATSRDELTQDNLMLRLIASAFGRSPLSVLQAAVRLRRDLTGVETPMTMVGSCVVTAAVNRDQFVLKRSGTDWALYRHAGDNLALAYGTSAFDESKMAWDRPNEADYQEALSKLHQPTG